MHLNGFGSLIYKVDPSAFGPSRNDFRVSTLGRAPWQSVRPLCSYPATSHKGKLW